MVSQSIVILVLVAVVLVKSAESENNVFKFIVSKDTIKNYQKNKPIDLFWRPSPTQKPAQEQESQEEKCGYESCPKPKPGMLNVHLVSHTHDDVGWTDTVDQYYYREVEYILDSVTTELKKNPQRRFIYVEVAFFYMWWREQEKNVKKDVRKLVNQGKLEFILGGWSMNDEAATHYNAIIDQHTLGFRFLQDTFGECGRPRIGWQIDPFGHSREQASLFAQFGFDGLFFGRLDYQDKENRQETKTMEMLWQGSPENLGDQASLLTGVLPNGYNPPSGFCFDMFCDDYIQTDDRIQDENKDEKVQDFLKAARTQAKSYATNQILMTMGADFHYQNSLKNFKNIDKLIKYVNKEQSNGSTVNIFYSTPSCYLKAIHQANITYTTKEDDFFPYAHRPHSFWTGYFTSRPALKRYVRASNNFLQACKQLSALTQLGSEYDSDIKIDKLRHAMGVLQHHDAVSGTETQEVTWDYAQKLSSGIAACQDVVDFAYGKLLARGTGIIPTQMFCPLLNVSSCPITEDSRQYTLPQFTVTLYNPIARPTTHWVRVPVTFSEYEVTDSSNKPVDSQVLPLSAETIKIPDRNGSSATGELVFQAMLPPLGFATYFAVKAQDSNRRRTPKPVSLSAETVLENQHLRLTFDPITGLLSGVLNKDESMFTNLSQNLYYYEGHLGNDATDEQQASGAYIFRPKFQEPSPIANKTNITVVKWPGVQEVRQVFDTWASQVVRLYDGAKHAEIEFTIGPITAPRELHSGREVVSKFTSDLETKGTFYTDANGREVLKRVRNYRPTWTLNQTEPVAGNYYPVNSRIYIKDEKSNAQLTILTDRSQGGTSIEDGELELMVHRKTKMDDGLGVGEPLDDPGLTGDGIVVRGTHYLHFGAADKATRFHRDLAERLYMAPIVSFSPLRLNPKEYMQEFNTQFSGVAAALPDNVHLLSLEQWRDSTLLLRLEHFYEKKDDPVLSAPAHVSLKGLFTKFTIVSVTELTLGANQELKDAKRFSWNIGKHTTNGDMSSFVIPVDMGTLTVVLKPMQIRTFELRIKTNVAT